MKVLIVSTHDRLGGAAIAAYRLLEALNKNGVEAKMMVLRKGSNNPNVIQVGNKHMNKARFIAERAAIFLKNSFSNKHLFDISIANTGISIVDYPEFIEADIIHLHWINQGMLSIKEIGEILASGKKVVWTMHDMWPFTGICHHAKECIHFKTVCELCPYLIDPSKNDISNTTFLQKQTAYSRGSIHFVSVSSWLTKQAKSSTLLKNHLISTIPNVINTDTFKHMDSVNTELSKVIRNRKTIVMGAARLDHPIKGFEYLKQALNILVNSNKINPDDLFLLLFGKVKYPNLFFNNIPIKYLHIGSIINNEEIAQIYSTADVIVVPSLYETFGQTITEAMACGCPAVSFNNSGQTDIIDHQVNGYLAEYKNASDFAKGIYWTLYEADKKTLANACRSKVLKNYSEKTIAEKYLNIYNRA